MVIDPPSRRPSATLEGPNPLGQNPGANANPANIVEGSHVPEQHIPIRHGKDPVVPEGLTNQGFTEEGDDQGYVEGGYLPTAADVEIEKLKGLLLEKDQINQGLTHQLADALKKQAGRPRKKKTQSTRRIETEVTETSIVHTKAQTRTGPMTRQQTTSAQVP